MKRNLRLLLFIPFLLFFQIGMTYAAAANETTLHLANPAAFVTTWHIATANESILIPINPGLDGYNYVVDWGDGNVSNNQSGDATHVYSAAGNYTVSITGNFPAIQFGSATSVADNDAKLLTVEQWGTQQWKGMDKAFMGCTNLTTVSSTDVPLFQAQSTLYCMFYGCSSFNSDLDNWDLHNVRETSFMFYMATHFNGNISDWNVSNVTNMQSMFYAANAFNRNLNNWDVSSVTLMDNMFSSTALYNQPMTNWKVSKVTDMNTMFASAASFNSDISNWDVSGVVNMNSMFANAASFNSDISNWKVSKVTDMSSMFSNAVLFNSNISNWDVSNVTIMQSMFYYASAFNSNISNWDVSGVVNMSFMFASATVYNQPMTNWNVTKVTNMTRMFDDAAAFDGDISNWDVSGVVNMSFMFAQASLFNQNIGSWNVSHVENMRDMFYMDDSFNQDLASWQVGAVKDMTDMFNMASSFDQDLASWQVGAVGKMDGMFDNCALSAVNYKAILNGWAAQSVQSGVTLGVAGRKYCGVPTGRQTLINTYGWNIIGDRAVCLVPAHPDANGIVYVDANVSSQGDGGSWTSALKFLSNATESARENTAIKEIHIAKGSYYPTGDRNSAYRDSSFMITRSGLKIIGGYPSGGGAPDYQTNPTILSGDLNLQGDTIDNSFHIMIVQGNDDGFDSLVVQGLQFTLSNGNGADNGYNDPFSNGGGGAILIGVKDNTAFRNCTFYKNYSSTGAGMVISGNINEANPDPFVCAPLIINCIFKENVALPNSDATGGIVGGAMVNVVASPRIEYCSFVGNRSYIGGAMINAELASPTIIGSTFTGNTASSMSVLTNYFSANTTFINCLMQDNITTGNLGEIFGDPTDALMEDAVIGNLGFCTTRLINTTMSANSPRNAPSTTGGVIVNIALSNSYITNSIIWGNGNPTIISDDGSAANIAYSLVEGMPANAQNHNLDGMGSYKIFVDSTQRNYQLNPASLPIDAGLNDSLVNALTPFGLTNTVGGIDLAGNPRIYGGAASNVIDMGAFEVQGAALPVKMSALKGHVDKQQHAQLAWSTFSELQNKGFQVQLSSDGVHFSNIDFVPSQASDGTSSVSISYSLDAGVLTGVKYYRILQTDLNGHTNGSNTVRLEAGEVTFGLRAYPNPAHNSINIEVKGSMGKNAQIQVINQLGQVVIQKGITANQSNLDLTKLAAGMYFIKYTDEKRSTSTRFIKN